MRPDISIIVPFLNEADNLPVVLSSLQEYCSKLGCLSFEVLFVDDGSTDDSLEVLNRSRLKGVAVKAIKLSKNFGSHAALRAGIECASGEYLVFLYADLQDPLELVGRLYEQCRLGYDIVWASRESGPGTNHTLGSLFYAFLMRNFVISAYPQSGFDVVMFTRKIQAEMNKNVEANSSIFLQILSLGHKQSRISYVKRERKIGESKWTLGKKIKMLIDSFVAFSFLPLRLVTVAGIFYFIAGLCWTGYLVIRQLIWNDIVSGWPALMSVLLTGFGLTNISLGVIAEYIWRTLDVARQRPVFVIEQIIPLPGDQGGPAR